ncbi:MAG: GIN domain-containing protein [Asticcacaulis sp.]
MRIFLAPFSGLAGSLALAASVAALGAGMAHAEVSLAGDGPQVELRDLVGRVVVTPENRGDVDIRVRYGKAKVPVMMVSHRGNTTVLDGHLSSLQHGMHLNINFDFDDDARHSGRVFISGLGDVDINDLPMVFVRVPMNAEIKDSAYSFGTIGASNSLNFILNGPGNWNIAPVNGPLNIIDSGSGSVRVAGAGDSVVDNMGSSDIKVGRVRRLKLSLSGSGNFEAQQSDETILQNMGSSDVNLGKVGQLRAQLNGSGDLSLDGVGGVFTLVNTGSSDVTVNRLDGPATLQMMGSGDVHIHGGQAPSFIVKGTGSGDVDFNGTAGVVTIDTMGSGDVSIMRATGPVTSRTNGSGETHIGH